jgi:exonuclease-1
MTVRTCAVVYNLLAWKAPQAEIIAYVVAPYKADAELAYLEIVGLVDVILPKNSDFLVFRCKNILYKLDVVESRLISTPYLFMVGQIRRFARCVVPRHESWALVVSSLGF